MTSMTSTPHTIIQPDRPTLDIGGLCKRFGSKTALHDVSLAAEPGTLTVILGPAGAGKTTTLRMIAGLDTPDAGTIALQGVDMQGVEPKDRDIAMIFDNLALYPNKTGYENIASPLLIRNIPWQEVQTRVFALAATLRISHVLKRLPKTMSGGERQRVALGRALIRTPRLFLLDEPLSSLDAKLRIELRAELKRLQREHGHTFVLATPDFHEAMAIADTVIMLREGRVVQKATPQQLYDAPADRDVALFVGAPQVNLVTAQYQPDTGCMQAMGARLVVPDHLVRVLNGMPGEFELGIRPENLALAPPDSADIRCRLLDVEPLGLKSVLTVHNDHGQLRLFVDSVVAGGLHNGQEVGLNLLHTGKMLAFDPHSGRNMAL